MTQANPLELAKQGNPQAIASLINRSLQPKGITARVTLLQGALQVILDSAQVPDQKILAAYIYKGVSSLEVPTIKKLKVYGRQRGQDMPAWTQEFNLAATESINSAKEPIKAASVAPAISVPPQPQLIEKPAPVSPLRSPSSSILTAQQYEEAIREKGHFPQKGFLGSAYDAVIPTLARSLVLFLQTKGEFLDAIAVRYQGEMAALILTENSLACFSFPAFSRKVRKCFLVNLKNIEKVVVSRQGFKIYHQNELLYLYFSDRKLARKLINSQLYSLVPVEKRNLALFDGYEVTLRTFGCLTLILALILNFFALITVIIFLMNQFL